MFIQTVRTPQRTGRATTLPAAVISKSLFYGLQLARHYHSSKYLIFGIPTRKLDYMTWDSVAWQIGSTGSFKFYDGPFQLPEQDDRKYRLLQLENGLKAVLVHDPSADKAAACATVAVGYLHDPDDMPGLAHFCEHMLSKGSKTYPAENDFLSFITSNGGSRNAGTGLNYTNYWFSISPNLLKEGLSRLAASFSAPLFTPSVTSREINAVDSENKKNLQNDGRRVYHLLNSLSTPGHPFGKFSTGNNDSLMETARRLEKEGRLPSLTGVEGDGGPVGRETRRRLIEWWKSNYCAGRMTLAVLGKETLDEMMKAVVQDFSSVENRGLDPRPSVQEPPWNDKQMGTTVFVKSIKDVYWLFLSFLIPDQKPHLFSKPARYLAHFIGHEGPGSIYAYLKGKGWVTSLSAGADTTNRGIQKFNIRVSLTQAGYDNYCEVLLAIYSYLSVLRSSSFSAYHAEEVQALAEIRFRFREKTQPHSYVSWLASELAEDYPPGLFLKAPYLVTEWDEPLFQKLLENFNPQKGQVMLMAREHPNVIPEGGWKIEKWYGTEYYVQKLEPWLVQKALELNSNLQLVLPRPNPYIPTKFDVKKVEVSEPEKVPKLIEETDRSRLWHKKDDQFWVPKATIKVDIRSPLIYVTPRHSVLTRLLAKLVEDALAEVTYDARLGGLSFSVDTFQEVFTITVSGLNDKLAVLLRTVLEKTYTLLVDPNRLAIVREELERGWKNFYLSQPTDLADHRWCSLLTPLIWSPAERLNELGRITPQDVMKHRDEIFAQTWVETLVNGNLAAQDAIALSNMVDSLLTSKSSAFNGYSRRSFIIPEGSNLVFRENLSDPKEVNSCIAYYCQCELVTNSRIRAAIELIVHILREPCFSQLRTVEQLGYIVFAFRWDTANTIGVGIEIQSTKDPAYLEERINVFLHTFREKLQTWSEHDLELQKEGLIVKKLQKLKNLGEESSRFINHIRSGYYDFTRHETDGSIVRELQVADVLSAFDTYILPSSASRRKLSIHMLSQTLTPSPLPEDVTVIEDEITFKAGLLTTPSALPIDQRVFGSVSRVSRPRL